MNSTPSRRTAVVGLLGGVGVLLLSGCGRDAERAYEGDVSFPAFAPPKEKVAPVRLTRVASGVGPTNSVQTIEAGVALFAGGTDRGDNIAASAISVTDGRKLWGSHRHSSHQGLRRCSEHHGVV